MLSQNENSHTHMFECQEVIICVSKAILLHHKMITFSVQKDSFRNAKQQLL